MAAIGSKWRETLAWYDALIPGAAERFIVAWEQESAHRRQVELTQLDVFQREMGTLSAERRYGLWMGFALAAIGLVGLVVMALQRVPLEGMGAVVVALGGLVWAVRRSTRVSPEPPGSDANPAERE